MGISYYFCAGEYPTKPFVVVVFFLVCVFLLSSFSNTLPVYATQCLTLEWKYHQDKRCPTKTKQLDALPASPKVRLVNVKWSSINLQKICCDSLFFKTKTLSILHLEPHRTVGRQKIDLETHFFVLLHGNL